jgi:D-alanine-D-alanine ligase-like ATP-grasp enzyme
MRRRVQALLAKTREPVICEEFIHGRDLYVAVLGNGVVQVMPPVELVIGRRSIPRRPKSPRGG